MLYDTSIEPVASSLLILPELLNNVEHPLAAHDVGGNVRRLVPFPELSFVIPNREKVASRKLCINKDTFIHLTTELRELLPILYGLRRSKHSIPLCVSVEPLTTPFSTSNA